MFDLFFNVGPAISIIFELGIEPKEDEFYTPTDTQYKALEEQGIDKSTVWYMWLPKDYRKQDKEVMVVSESEKNNLLEARKIIDNYCEKSSKNFESYKEKLKYAAERMPPVFTDGTKYKRSHLKIVE